MAYEDVFNMAALQCETCEGGMTTASIQRYYDYISKYVDEASMKYTTNELLDLMILADADTIEDSVNAMSTVYADIEIDDYIAFVKIARKIRKGEQLKSDDALLLDTFNFKNPYLQLAAVSCITRYAMQNDRDNIERLKGYMRQADDLNAQIQLIDESKSARGFHVNSI